MLIKEDIVKFIKQLTADDKKTLSQKALKVSEESGELAKAMLSFESAHGTTHRFVDETKILEEVIDVILTSISIAYELGVSDDEIEAMLGKKLRKWADLQQREDRMNETIPFEIHVTVRDVEENHFREVCHDLGVKPIILDLQATDGSTIMEDVMTSSKHYGNNSSAYLELQRIYTGLILEGMTVVRRKIETVPWHPAAPSTKHTFPTMPANCYFETHIAVISSDDRKDELKRISESYNAHLSRNMFKKLEGDDYVVMITYRTFTQLREEFEAHARELREVLKANEFQINDIVTEFSIYDTKEGHDSKWLKNLDKE